MEFIKKLFNGFTYRQLILAPAISYIFFAPYPAYLVEEFCRFWLRQYEWQLEGNTIQKTINQMLNHLSQLQILTSSALLNGATINPEEIEESIREVNSHFIILMEYNDKISQTENRLAAGFSMLRAPSLEIDPIYGKWNAFYRSIKSQSLKESEAMLQEIINLLRIELIDLGYSYALFEGRNPSTFHYASLVLKRLPRLLELAKEISTKSALASSAQMEDDALNSQLFALYELAKNGKQESEIAFETLYRTYRETEKHSISQLDGLRKTFYNFSSKLGAFLELISEGGRISKENFPNIEEIIETKRELYDRLYSTQQPLLERQLLSYQHFFYLFIIQFVVLLFFAWIIVRFRGLSIHLVELGAHIRRLAKGELSPCFATKEHNEFGVIGSALDKVVDVLKIIVSDLAMFSKKIGEITQRVAWAVNEQEFSLLEQEKIILDGKKRALEISERATFLSDLLAQISRSSELSTQADQAHSDLRKMRTNMNYLIKASGDFLNNFEAFSTIVNQSQTKVNFMDKLGEEAKMLSLNGKIENANILRSAGNFSEITQKIERFSISSDESTSKIKKIIQEIHGGVKTVKREAKRCLSEIGAGVGQLAIVSDKLEEIAKLGEDQQRKISRVEGLMKEQSVTSQKIIDSVQKLLIPAHENVGLVHEMQVILDVIVIQQKKLSEIMSRLVFS